MAFKTERFYQARRSQSKPLSLRYADVEGLSTPRTHQLNIINENEQYSDSDETGIGEYDGGRNEV